MPRVVVVFTLALLLSTAGCSSLRFPGVYRVDIPQGNFVTEDMLAQIQPGMTPEQIRFALGAPTLVDPFTEDTWFYLMTYRPGKGEKVDQQIVVYFENGVYSHHEGEVIDDFRSKTAGQQDRELEQQRRRSEAERPALQPGRAAEPQQPSPESDPQSGPMMTAPGSVEQ